MILEIMKCVIDTCFAWMFLRGCKKSVLVYCSARDLEHNLRQEAVEFGYLLQESNLKLFTGGGSGLMNEVHKGHQMPIKKNKAKSFGATIHIKGETPSKYATRKYQFMSFHTRKWYELEHSAVVVVLDGGVGTMEELFEAITLIQTERIKPIPIILNKRMHDALMPWIEQALELGTISYDTLNNIYGCKDVIGMAKLCKKFVGEA